MKSKKILSAAVASALVAAQMAMPVMAAEEDGFDVTVTTKTPVIRVVVPTTLEVAVNQFGMSDSGSQIYSTPFVMENKSQVPVKVSVTSTATLGDDITLAATRTAVEASTKEGEAWLAVAAQTAVDNYADGSTTFDKLTEENNNVTAFVQGSGATATAGQTFYLAETSNMAYKLLAASEDATNIKYAQFYELIPVTLTGSTDADKEADLKALVAKQDIYSVVTANLGNEGETVTCLAKGTAAASVSYASTNSYFTASITAALPGDVNNTTHTQQYVYGDGATDTTNGKAAFRYIGALSGAQETWTKDDISKIGVRYSITGVEEAKYDSVYKNNCTYGLYTAPFTDDTAYGNWGSDGVLWLAKDASTGFSTTGLVVEVSDGGKTYTLLDADKYTVDSTSGWVSITGDNIVAGLGNQLTGTLYIRVTDGTTRYVFENK